MPLRTHIECGLWYSVVTKYEVNKRGNDNNLYLVRKKNTEI